MKLRSFSEAEKKLLLELARGAIAARLGRGSGIEIDYENIAPNLSAKVASFVTLKIGGCLRGCVGTIEARLPLVDDVTVNAVGAAFRDSRFPPVDKGELAKLSISISILSDHERINYSDENDLLSKLRPGVDGLIIEQGGEASTFLPAVWKTLPDPAAFLESLKEKGNFTGTLDGNKQTVSRYVSTSWSDPAH